MLRVPVVLPGISLVLLAALLAGCGEDSLVDPRAEYSGPIDPSLEPEKLNRQLEVDGELRDGGMLSSVDPDGPVILASQQSASVTADNTLFLPFAYRAASPVSGVNLAVEGAESHWFVPVPGGTAQGTHVVPIGLPALVLPGSFQLDYQLVDQAGRAGAIAGLQIAIVAPIAGNGGSVTFPRVDGRDGLTVRTYDLGTTEGTVTIRWDTFTVPDRVDVRYGGEWARSTGTLLDQLGAPPILDCSSAGSADGFVGSSGSFSFALDKSHGRMLDVYVSGCMNGGTQWWFQVSVTSASGGAWYDALPDCPCVAADVPIGSTRDATGAVTGEWVAYGAADQTYHPGAVTEYRWEPTNSVAGQQCTYDATGRLITSGLGAGTPDRYSPGANLPMHAVVDVGGWYTESCLSYLTDWKPDNDLCGDSNPVNPITHLVAMIGDMPCPRVANLIRVIAASTVASPTLKSYVAGTLGYMPPVSVLRADLQAILDGPPLVPPDWTVVKEAQDNLARMAGAESGLASMTEVDR